MYQNLPQTNPYYQYSYSPQYQRLAQMEQAQQMNTLGMPSNTPPSTSYLKGRPVVSFEEARAAQIDLDGSLFIFTDIGNKKIYTKQINLDGTATLNTYSLVENVAPIEKDYVTKTELDEIIEALKKEWNERNEIKDETKQQSGIVKTTVHKQSSF